jgi:hypothetical protein
MNPLASELDSPRTLVLAFGGWELKDDPTPFRDLGQAFPHSVVVGCSTSGEIAGRSVQDGTVRVALSRFQRTELRFVHAPWRITHNRLRLRNSLRRTSPVMT